MSLYVLRTCLTGGEISWSACSYWQQNSRKLQQLRTQLPYNVRNSYKTSNWNNQSRRSGKRHFVHSPGNQSQDNYALGRLWKPFVFSISLSGVSIAGAAIWQYENVRSQAIQAKKWWGNIHSPKYGPFRRHLNSWWNNLSSADKTFMPICVLNILVFMAWKVPAYQNFMSQYFMAGLTSKALCWPMLLCVFSHQNLMHLAANMFVLHSFSEQAMVALGKEQFVAFYLSAGLVSSFTSYLFKAIIKSPSRSLGASGAVMGVLAYVCSKNPNTQLAVILLPQFPFSGDTGLKSLLCLDLAGCIFQWQYFDHAAHLGGSLFGIAWFYYGSEFIWRKREPLISSWHKLRGAIK